MHFHPTTSRGIPTKQMTLKQRLERLEDNYIRIEKHESGSYIVIDERYDNTDHAFDTYEKAIKYAEKLIGIY